MYNLKIQFADQYIHTTTVPQEHVKQVVAEIRSDGLTIEQEDGSFITHYGVITVEGFKQILN